MDESSYLASLQQSLAHSAAAESPQVQAAAERIALALQPALRLLLIEMAADIAAEVTAGLDGEIVDIRMRGGSPELVITPHPVDDGDGASTDGQADAEPTSSAGADIGADAAMARISLRMPESLKGQVDAAATTAELSANAWIVRAVSQALHAGTPSKSRRSRQVSGWLR